jgi:uncharacterized lipoprotein YddW (UPF0748 family)
MPTLRITQNTVFKRSLQSSISESVFECNLNVGQVIEADYAFRVGSHCFVKLKQPLEAVGTSGYFVLSHVETVIEELRGVWLTNVDSVVLHSQSNIQQALQQLKAIGFNTIYPVVWQRGLTLYPSAVAEQLTGYPVMPHSAFSQRDMLAELIAAAKPLHLRVLPWFEYGLATLPHSDLAKRNPHLLSCDRRGETIRIKQTDRKPDSFVWLNPCHEEVQQFFTALMAELVQQSEIDGIQLDDHFGFPVELGYDPVSVAHYRQHVSKAMPHSLLHRSQHPDKVQWASRQLTHLLKQIVEAVRAHRPDSLISLSPNPLGFSKVNYAIDWHQWIQQGLIDELVLQVYRDQPFRFQQEINKREVIQSCKQIPVAIGILSGLRVKSVPTSRLVQQIQAVRRQRFAGFSCFFYETLFNESLSPNVARNFADLAQLFN